MVSAAGPCKYLRRKENGLNRRDSLQGSKRRASQLAQEAQTTTKSSRRTSIKPIVGAKEEAALRQILFAVALSLGAVMFTPRYQC